MSNLPQNDENQGSQTVIRDEIKRFMQEASRVYVDDTTEVTSLRKTAEEALTSIKASQSSIDNFVKQYEKAATDFSSWTESNQQSLNQLAEEFKKQYDATIGIIQESKKSISAVSSEVTELRSAISENSRFIQEAKTKTEADTKVIAENLTQTKSHVDKTSLFLADSEKYRNDSLELNEKIKKDGANVAAILKTAEDKDKKVQTYEKQLEQLIKESNELRGQIESLLPGAASASLAKSFTDRKKEMAKPKTIWASIQLISIVAFIGMGVYIFLHPEPVSWQEWIILVIRKSPILVGLILLEEVARRNYNVAERLEEDYGYKSVLASSFIGYRDQMMKIDTGEANSTVSKLANNLLESLGREPGKLIDKVKSARRASEIFDKWIKEENKEKTS